MSEMDTFVEPVLPAGADGWAFWRGDECKGYLDVTKRGLLVSYDMMSLKGLSACEATMNAKGWQVRPTAIRVVPAGDPPMFAAAVDGTISPAMAAWSVCSESAERTMKSTAYYLDVVFRDNRWPSGMQMIDTADGLVLSRFFWLERDRADPSLPQDKRRTRTLDKVRLQVHAIFQRLNIQIVCARYEVVAEP